VARLQIARLLKEAQPLKQKLVRWAADNAEALGATDPAPIKGLTDRANDKWGPLLAIAELAGGDWPLKAGKAALDLAALRDNGAEDVGLQVLVDIRAVFDEHGNPAWLETSKLVSDLVEMDRCRALVRQHSHFRTPLPARTS
jgi:hypothetical protein